MVRKIAIVGVGSGLGAADKRTQDGPQEIITQISRKYPKIPIFYKYYGGVHESAAAERRRDITQILGELYQTIYDLKKDGYFIIVLTGDHTYVLSIQAALKAATGSAENTLLYIDAHMDAHTPRSSQSKNPHGMPNSTILGYGGYKEWSCYRGSIKARNFHLFGVRSFEPYEDRILHKIGAGENINYMKDMVDGGELGRLLEGAALGAAAAYSLSIDVDGFDPVLMPGTGYREPHGIHPREVLPFLRRAGKDKKCEIIEITEFNPHKDINKKTLRWIIRFIDAIIVGK